MNRPVRVLCVGDTAKMQTTAQILEREHAGLQTETTADTPQALDATDFGAVDVVVIDPASLRQDDSTVLAAVSELHSQGPIIFFTESWHDGVPEWVAESPTTTVVQRTGNPIQYQVLADTIAARAKRREHRNRSPSPRRTPTQAERTKWLVDGFPDVAFFIDESGRYVDIIAGSDSPLLVATGEKLLGNHIEDVFSPESAQRFQETIDRALETGDVQTIQYKLNVRAGERWFEGKIGPVDTDSNPQLVNWVARDITERKRRELVLETLHETATTIHTAESLTEVCERTIDAATEILEFDMCTIVLREDDWLVPYCTSADAPPDGSRRMRIDQGLAGKTFQTGETQLLSEITPDSGADPAREEYRSGLSVPIDEYGVFQAVSNEPNGFDEQDVAFAELLVSHTANVIERLLRERELTRQRERLDDFASVVSHDLRNPLNVANIRLSLAAEECDSEHIESIDHALGRMERLIDELLTLSRAGDAVGETEPVALDALIEECWNNVETSNATIEYAVERTVFADRTRLASVFENLFRNAVEHGQRSENSTDEQDESVRITVGELEDGFYIEDDGDGITESERNRLFESGYSTKVDGTGFGLSIVREIVEAHDWRIRVTNGDSGGARFEITGVEFVPEREH